MIDLENQMLGKYELIREIGRGSMGAVYLGRDPFSLREVAVKVSEEVALASSRGARRRRKLFFIEARAAGMLRHPNIIATFDAGIEDAIRYIVMEYVPGALTLERYTRPHSLLPVQRVVGIALKCALALGYAHEMNVVHRDIKPKNVMLTQDHDVKLCDFGIALMTGDDLDETQVVGTLGSPRYMSPEQVSGEQVTHQTDIFSLGVVIYEMLAGVHPFRGSSMMEVGRRITHEAHAPLRDVRPDVPDALAHIVDRTLKKHPAGRYRTAMDLAGDLSLVYDDMSFAEREFSLAGGKLERLRSLAFFKEFDDSDIIEVLNAGSWERFEPGQTIIVEGELGDAFYVLVAGEVIVRRADLDVDRLKPGASFGEIGFIIRKERTATIVADGHVTVLRVSAGLIDTTSVGCQLRFRTAFLRTMAERLSAAMDYIGRSGER